MSTIAHVLIQIVEDAGTASSEIAHVVIQTIDKRTFPSEIAHVIVQVVTGQPPVIVIGDELSGIYTIEPNKVLRHDSYYGNNEKKIPNPTIRTGRIGD